MGVGLHRVVHPGERGERLAQPPRALLDRREVVDVARPPVADEADQALPLSLPPAGRSPRPRGASPFEPLPRGPQPRCVPLGREQPAVQATHECPGVLLVDDEGEVQVLGGIAHEVDRPLVEGRESRSELVKHGANPTPDDRHHRARMHDADSTERLEALHEPREHRALRATGQAIQRQAQRRLGSAHEIHGHAQLLERREGSSQETGDVPHRERGQVEQRHSAPTGDRGDPRMVVLGRLDASALGFGMIGVVDRQGDPLHGHGLDAARMQDPGAQGGELLSLAIPEAAHEACGGKETGIGGEQARHVGPDLQLLRVQQGREQRTQVSLPPRPRRHVSSPTRAMNPCVSTRSAAFAWRSHRCGSVSTATRASR